MNKIKVVIDTNVFINGIFKKDSFSQALFNLKSLDKIVFVMNKEMQNELLVTFSKILIEAYKKIGKEKDMINVIPLCATLSKCLWQVEEVDHIIHTNYCVNDKSDNKFVDCCIDSNVTFLITQDEHINGVADQLKQDYNIEVLSPMQFYTKYKTHQL